MRVFLESKTLMTCFFIVLGGLALNCGGANETSNTSGSNPPRMGGKQIVDEYLKRDASPYRKSRIRFTVTEEGVPERVYEIDNWRKQTADETTTLNDIIAPADEAGTRTLTIEAKGKKTLVVTYAVSRDEFRETDSKKMFFGGLTVGELLGDWDKFDFRFIGEKDVGGLKTYEVEGKLKSDSDSVVTRMDVFFRADNYVPAETHLFGADGKEMRTYKTVTVKDDPAHPYASRVEVDNSIYKAHIVIEILSREWPASIDDSTFAREKLKESVKK